MEYITEIFVWPAWLSWIFPMLGAVLTPLLAKVHSKVRDYGAIVFSFLAMVMTLSLIPYLWEGKYFHNQVLWVVMEGAPVLSRLMAGVIVDPLSIIMANVVAVIGFLIMVYSLGYMHGDPSLTRYWFFMNFFIGSMLLLVMSDNIIQLLFGWEGVGLCSYALIGFWHRDSKEDWLKCWVGEGPEAYPPSHCGMKAFITTRMGDLFFLLGAFLLLAFAGTLNFVELQGGAILRVPLAVLIPAAILLFGGPIGKSAQLPLMEWLPDAMAGPTTVSALIHAATMVNAGVYLVGRVFPMFYTAVWHGGAANELITFFYVIAWVGAITAFVAGSQGMVSSEIKKVLAYSTVSQLGYMMLALGIAGSTAEFLVGYVGGVFHLMSHAMFKAALFLTAGAVIHTCESRFMTHMGGIRRYMPITFWCMSLAAFSLMGVPLLFSGFWSKDMVLEAPLLAGQYWIFALGAVTVAVTSFYSVRMLGLTFFGPKSSHLAEQERHGHHVHEAPKVMWIPFLALVIGTLAFGVMGPFVKGWFEGVFHEYLGELLPAGGGHSEAVAVHGFPHELAVWVTAGISVAMLLAGALPAYFLYVKRKLEPSVFLQRYGLLAVLRQFVLNRWYINRFFYKAIVYPMIGGCMWALKKIELGVIDRFNYVLANATAGFSNSFRKTHSGILTHNVEGIILGFVVFFLLLALTVMG
ncbi:NADH-quinone oxidoreductase subunit L [Candidatus Hecatella orcuttiae]|jgi:NADH-quinone oxidoreductase subunit L|uniref:NADH-quinone oxidoreductase subunit 5 family protein n=1 Tax=Candidatus Hecatella orcuttiae TaxID=1935119 RepID=UPI0028680F34|nr:NADH-quinone oxidoreductase subunit L [Candidatus Hecatella orcuttiae]